MLFEGGFSFTNFLVNTLVIFLFVVWFWLLITVFSDLFRRQDISGWGKALWVIFLILLPYLTVFAYLISQGRGMEARGAQRADRSAGGVSTLRRVQRSRRTRETRRPQALRTDHRTGIRQPSPQARSVANG